MQWRTEPTHVEKCGDELGVAVKFQSNSEIAGSPRNSFRASVEIGQLCQIYRGSDSGVGIFRTVGRKSHGGRALIGLGVLPGLPNSVKLRMPSTYTEQSDYGC